MKGWYQDFMNYVNQDEVFKCGSKSNFFMFFFIIFFTYIKMSKNWSGKYYQDNKKRLQEKAFEKY